MVGGKRAVQLYVSAGHVLEEIWSKNCQWLFLFQTLNVWEKSLMYIIKCKSPLIKAEPESDTEKRVEGRHNETVWNWNLGLQSKTHFEKVCLKLFLLLGWFCSGIEVGFLKRTKNVEKKTAKKTLMEKCRVLNHKIC